MDQLPLFPDVAANAATAPAPTREIEETIAATSGAETTPQIGLFDARVQRLRTVRQSIAAGRFEEATGLLATVESGPDVDAKATLERIRNLAARVADADRAASRDAALALAAAGRDVIGDAEPWSSLGRTLLVRAAGIVEQAPGALAGRLYAEAGHLDRARAVLGSATEHASSAEVLFALGDVETLRRSPASARRHYRSALLIDPFGSAFEEALDDAVRSLAELAAAEFEIETEPRAWAAAVGIVIGLLPVPTDRATDLPLPAGRTPAEHAALTNMRAFVDALASTTAAQAPARPNDVLDARRTMKKLCPPLFARYMARRARM